MCRPLQCSSRCISTAKAYRAKTKGSWAVSANRIGAQSRFALASLRHLDVSTLHQRPRPHASPPLSLLNRSSAVSTLWMNATTSFADTGARPFRRYRHTCRNAQGLSTRQASSLRIQSFVAANRHVLGPEYVRVAYF